jgi:hypothetical protein
LFVASLAVVQPIAAVLVQQIKLFLMRVQKKMSDFHAKSDYFQFHNLLTIFEVSSSDGKEY